MPMALWQAKQYHFARALWKYYQAIAQSQTLALAYDEPEAKTPQQSWEMLIGIAKYLSRTGKTVTQAQIQEKMGLGDRTLDLGFSALEALGFSIQVNEQEVSISGTAQTLTETAEAIDLFLEAIAEEQFKRQYFYHVPFATVQRILTILSS